MIKSIKLLPLLLMFSFSVTLCACGSKPVDEVFMDNIPDEETVTVQVVEQTKDMEDVEEIKGVLSSVESREDLHKIKEHTLNETVYKAAKETLYPNIGKEVSIPSGKLVFEDDNIKITFDGVKKDGTLYIISCDAKNKNNFPVSVNMEGVAVNGLALNKNFTPETIEALQSVKMECELYEDDIISSQYDTIYGMAIGRIICAKEEQNAEKSAYKEADIDPEFLAFETASAKTILTDSYQTNFIGKEKVTAPKVENIPNGTSVYNENSISIEKVNVLEAKRIPVFSNTIPFSLKIVNNTDETIVFTPINSSFIDMDTNEKSMWTIEEITIPAKSHAYIQGVSDFFKYDFTREGKASLSAKTNMHGEEKNCVVNFFV